MTVVRSQSSVVSAAWGLWSVVQLCFALCVPAQAQQPRKIPLIGYPLPGNPTSESTDGEGLRLALRELGYIEGQSIAIECLFRS